MRWYVSCNIPTGGIQRHVPLMLVLIEAVCCWYIFHGFIDVKLLGTILIFSSHNAPFSSEIHILCGFFDIFINFCMKTRRRSVLIYEL